MAVEKLNDDSGAWCPQSEPAFFGSQLAALTAQHTVREYEYRSNGEQAALIDVSNGIGLTVEVAVEAGWSVDCESSHGFVSQYECTRY